MYEDKVYIKIMADYSSTGVWDESRANADPEEYKLAPEMVERLEKWCAWYETNQGYDPDWEDDFDYAAFSEEGYQIARHIKAAHPDWTVMYHDEFLRNTLEV